MADWHHDWITNTGLRPCGATSCGLSYFVIQARVAPRLAGGQSPQAALPFFLAAAGFPCAGAVLAVRRFASTSSV